MQLDGARSRLAGFHKLSLGQKFLVVQSALAAIAITPFGFWRFAKGDWKQGLFDFMLVALFAVVAYASTLNRYTRGVSIVSVLIYILAVTAVVTWFGPQMLFWSYPAIVAAFFVVRTHEAMLISLANTGLNFWLLYGTTDTFGLFTYATTATLVSIFAYLFATRMWQDNTRWQEAATIDPLTRAGNRRQLDDDMAKILASHNAITRPWAMLMFDIDHFKDVNDTYGHDTGDICLVRLAQEARNLLSEGQTLYRFGGEEFIILLPGNTQSGALLAERLRAHIEKTRLIREKNITVSVGVAQLLPGNDSRQWLRQVDDALYQAKNSGRNCVRIAAS